MQKGYAKIFEFFQKVTFFLIFHKKNEFKLINLVAKTISILGGWKISIPSWEFGIDCFDVQPSKLEIMREFL